jgi:hypothetical protein
MQMHFCLVYVFNATGQPRMKATAVGVASWQAFRSCLPPSDTGPWGWHEGASVLTGESAGQER